jgi:hypothetical protein
MWFNFVMKNHGATGAGEYLAPLTDYMRGTLGRCGHETTLVFDEIYPDAVNVFFEFFPDRTFIQQMLDLRRRHGLKIGIVATELMVDGTIPYAKHGMLFDGNKEAYFRNRIAGFEALLAGTDFLWSWLKRTADEYEGRCPVTRFFPVGHVAAAPPEMRRAPKDIDVIFFGSRTPHRAEVLDRLKERGVKVVCVGRGFPIGYKSKSHLDCLMDRARIGLSLNLHSREDTEKDIDPRFASCMRIAEMLGRDLCVVSEQIPLDNPYAPYMHSGEPQELADICARMLAQDRWREAGTDDAARFRRDMDVVKICKPIVDETVARLQA